MHPQGEGRRTHEANSGRDSKPVIWIFEGTNVLWMLLGAGLSLLAFRLCHGGLKWSLGESLVTALCPLLVTTLYVVLLKSGKPESFDREFFEWVAIRSRQVLDHLGLLRDLPYFAPPKISSKQPRPPTPTSKSNGNSH